MLYFSFIILAISVIVLSIHSSLNMKNILGISPVSKASKITKRQPFIDCAS